MIVSKIGRYAHQWLAQVEEATLLGKVAGGAYLLLPTERVILLSFGKFHGPLTLNLSGNADSLEEVQPGARVRVNPDFLFFPSLGLTINRVQAAIWEAAAPLKAALPRPRYYANLASLSRMALGMRQPGRLAELLPWVLGLQEGDPAPQNEFLPLLERLKEALKSASPAIIAVAIQPLLGMGSGLTPSGDDLTLGLLLACSRWGQVLKVGLKMEDLGQVIRRLDFRKTTTLAANLIECALHGQADERLILALDGILCGEPDLSTCADYLLSWGHSSGIDALVGIALAMCLGSPA